MIAARGVAGLPGPGARSGSSGESDLLASKGPLAEVADRSDRNRLRLRMDPVEEHVIPNHEAPQAGVHVVRQRASQARKIRQHPDSIAKVLQQTPSRSRILFPNEIKELRDP